MTVIPRIPSILCASLLIAATSTVNAGDPMSSREAFLAALANAASESDPAAANARSMALFAQLAAGAPLRSEYPGVDACASQSGKESLFSAAEGALMLALTPEKPDPATVGRSKKAFVEFVRACPHQLHQGKAFVDDVAAALIPVRERRVAREHAERRERDAAERRADALAAVAREEARLLRERAEATGAQEEGKERTDVRHRILTRAVIPVMAGADGSIVERGELLRGTTLYYTLPAVKGQRIELALDTGDVPARIRVYRESELDEIENARPVPGKPLDSANRFTAERDGAYVVALRADTSATPFRLAVTTTDSPPRSLLASSLFGVWRCAVSADTNVVLRYALDGTRLAHVTTANAEMIELARVGEFAGNRFVEERVARRWIQSPSGLQPVWLRTAFHADPYRSTHAFLDMEVAEATQDRLVLRNTGISNSNRADKRPRNPAPMACVRMPYEKGNYLEAHLRALPAEF